MVKYVAEACRQSRVEVYLSAYSDGWEAEISLARFLWSYCHVRPHSSLGGKTPHEVYIETKTCSSRPELTISGARAVQEKAPTSPGQVAFKMHLVAVFKVEKIKSAVGLEACIYALLNCRNSCKTMLALS